jgi:hypothetical protein
VGPQVTNGTKKGYGILKCSGTNVLYFEYSRSSERGFVCTQITILHFYLGYSDTTYLQLLFLNPKGGCCNLTVLLNHDKKVCTDLHHL